MSDGDERADMPDVPGPPGGVELAPGVTVPPGAVRVQASRSSGPGGQNVNKVNTRMELWVPLDAIAGLTERAKQRLAQQAGGRLTRAGEIHLWSEAERSQEGNREAVWQRLRELVQNALHEPKRRRRTRPTAASRQKRLQRKKERGQVKAQRRRVEPD
jgi:ribosome-associated protein